MLSLIVSMTLAALAVLLALAPRPAGAFDLQGHRGARGLAPENTLAAFRRALDVGVTTLETDLAITKDGIVVISHEPALFPPIVRDADGRWIATPGPPIRSLTLAELGGSVPALAAAAGCAAWSPNFAALSRERVEDARKRGLRVIPWTVNAPADMARLIDWGVDGLITDYPDRARKVLADKGIALP